MSRILVTGAAGFIGYHLSRRLLSGGDVVVGFDDLNTYYDVSLKRARLSQLCAQPNFRFVQADLADRDAVARVFAASSFDVVINLAAQAGVRHSIADPYTYVSSNVVGFLNVLEGCRHNRVGHLLFASSSSVYGANVRQPFSTRDHTDHPLSLYAATKKSDELMAHAYAHLYSIPCTGLRFFTVYGPWGRPDMAYFKFTKAIICGQTIDVYNGGHHKRDFTYVEDVVEAIVRLLPRPPNANASLVGTQLEANGSSAPYRLYNIGNHSPVELNYLIEVIESALGIKAHKNMLPLQPGDVAETFAEVNDLMNDVGFQPKTPIEEGIAHFVAWYREYHRV